MTNSLTAPLISSDDYVEIVRPLANRRLDVFYNHVFRDSLEAIEGRFVPGDHVDRWCVRLQSHTKTATKSARLHLKSTTFYAFLAWRLYRLLYAADAPAFEEWLYLSYSEGLSQYHLKKLKRYVEANPWLKPLVSLTDAESILHYRTPELPGSSEKREIIIEPTGIMTFKRGRHPHGVLADDVLRDPEVKLDLTQIEKITRIFLEEVVSMPKEGGYLHVVGTPQDKEDLFHALTQLTSFNVAEYPAIVDEERQVVLWPQMFPFERLVEIRDKEIGKKAFLKEYQCRPVRAVSGYFEDAEIDAIIDPGLPPLAIGTATPGKVYVMGLDLGKKTHPSHLVLFEDTGTELVQRLSRWFDRTDYTDQVDVVKALDDLYTLSGFCYDDTRAELEGFKERQELPTCALGVPMTAKAKFECAAMFGRRVRHKTIRLLPDPRQRRQLLSVDDNLQAPENAEGHGDAFFSIMLACKAAELQTTPVVGFASLRSERREEDDE
jgi:hypothetical protein